MNVLCIGNGASLPQYTEYIVFNNYDVRIGTKLQMTQQDYTLDYIAAADEPPVKYIIENHREWAERTITRPLWRDKHSRESGVEMLTPQDFQHGDVTGTLQIKYAIQLGATAITTIAMDSLASSWKKNTQWSWSSTIDSKIMKPWDIDRKQQKLLKTWSDQIRCIERQHPEIEWKHKHIGNINE